MTNDIRSNFLTLFVVETIKCYSVSAVLSLGILLVVSLYVNCIVFYYIGGILFLMTLLEPLVMKWKPKKRISPTGKAVFITGCDRGFGHISALRLDDLGFHVFAGCLFPDGEGAAKLRKSGSNRLHVFSLDVTIDNSVQEAAEYVKENLNDNVLWAVVNNAGILCVSELQDTEMRTIERVIEVNTMGVVRVTKSFLPMLMKSKGRVVTIASTAGRFTLPWIVPYCMSKQASISFSDGLRLEMYKYGVPVISIEPGFFRTPMLDDANQAAANSSAKIANDGNNMGVTYSPPIGLVKALRLVGIFTKDPCEVVSVVEEAITTLYPQYHYSPGHLIFSSGIWLANRSPKSVVDVFFYMCEWLIKGKI